MKKSRDSIFLFLTNFIYRRNYHIRRFKEKYPDENVYLCTPAKAIITKSDQMKWLGFAWIFAKRANLVISDKRLTLNEGQKINIPLKDVSKAKLYLFSGISSGSVLAVAYNDFTYQFGTNVRKFWEEQDLISLEIIPATIANRIYSIVMRLVFLYILLKYVFRLF